MKPQDILFLLIIAGLLIKRNPRYFVITGLAMLMLSIPLFAKWVFFTAERLTWYAALCMLIASTLFLLQERYKKSS